MLLLAVFEIKHIRVMSLTFRGHVTSSVTWLNNHTTCEKGDTTTLLSRRLLNWTNVTTLRVFCTKTVISSFFIFHSFYRAMHFSAKRGIAIACRLSVCLSVRLSVCDVVNCDHIGWNSSKIISRSVSLGCSLFATQTSQVYSKGNTPKFSPE